MTELHWYQIDNPKGQTVPRWQCQAACAADGTIFAPAAIAGNETAVFLCAGYDGVPCVVDAKHVYLPTDWLAREYPAVRDICAVIEKRVREAELPYAAATVV